MGTLCGGQRTVTYVWRTDWLDNGRTHWISRPGAVRTGHGWKTSRYSVPLLNHCVGTAVTAFLRFPGIEQPVLQSVEDQRRVMGVDRGCASREPPFRDGGRGSSCSIFIQDIGLEPWTTVLPCNFRLLHFDSCRHLRHFCFFDRCNTVNLGTLPKRLIYLYRHCDLRTMRCDPLSSLVRPERRQTPLFNIGDVAYNGHAAALLLRRGVRRLNHERARLLRRRRQTWSLHGLAPRLRTCALRANTRVPAV